MDNKLEKETSAAVSQNGDKPYAEIFIQTSLETMMGKAIDLARISGMADRSFGQFEKTIKKEFYELIKFIIDDLKTRGYITKDEKQNKAA